MYATEELFILNFHSHPSRLSLPLSLPLFLFSVSEVVKLASKKKLSPHVKNVVLEIIASDEADQDAEVPYIKYNFRR